MIINFYYLIGNHFRLLPNASFPTDIFTCFRTLYWFTYNAKQQSFLWRILLISTKFHTSCTRSSTTHTPGTARNRSPAQSRHNLLSKQKWYQLGKGVIIWYPHLEILRISRGHYGTLLKTSSSYSGKKPWILLLYIITLVHRSGVDMNHYTIIYCSLNFFHCFLRSREKEKYLTEYRDACLFIY